ncbi:MAG TPA: hypothetical protein VIM55_20090 [Mucilaginibacter sp.]
MSRKVYHSQYALFVEETDAVQTSVFMSTSQTYISKIKALDSVIRKLRVDDLAQGHCFMIFDENLPEDEAYYEYPDGTIKIERLDKRNIEIPRVVVKVLNKNEASAVKRRHAVIFA